MNVVLLAGGFGTRLSEETTLRPKPMVEIGGIPILVHIMNTYAHFGFRDFFVACGYRGDFIKDYFTSYQLKHTDWALNLRTGERTSFGTSAPDWNVTLVDTGLHTMTGGRIRRLREHLEGSTFMATYGDGVASLDVGELVDYHRRQGKLATLSAVRPPARFGCLDLRDGLVRTFEEKPQVGEGWINGGFFVFEPGIFDYLEDDSTVLEKSPLEKLARDGQLAAYQHHGFWQPMDTLRDKQQLENLWNSGQAPWRRKEADRECTQLLPLSERSTDVGNAAREIPTRRPA